MSQLPPGPKGRPIVGVMPDFRQDALGLIMRATHEYGRIVHLPLGPLQMILLSDPALIEQVLVHQHRKFEKGGILRRSGRLLGQGLLTSHGETWVRHRRLIQPAFHATRIAEYGRVMVDLALRHTERWEPGQTRDMAEEMMELTLAVATKTLFGTELNADARRIGEAVGITMNYLVSRFRSVIKLPEWIPTPAVRKADAAFRDLDTITYRLIDQRQAGAGMGDDLLSLLVQAVDEDGQSLSREELRDEIMTMLLAGHETTALAMTWMLWLLDRHLDVEARLHAELTDVLGGRPPELADLPRLPYTDAVMRESLRLYSPIWAIPRMPVEPLELGGYHVPAGASVFIAQWVVHRDPEYFPDPESFRPERWLDGLAKRLPAFAYFPFGGGPRRCIGAGFAELEIVMLLATLAQRYRFRTVEGHPVVPLPLMTLRPRYGIKMTVQAR